MENLTPYVINKTLKKKKFDANLIFESLIKETSISESNAEKVVTDVSRKIIAISSLIPYLTAPMIREFVNVSLLQFGFIEERRKYTRIGFPRYDLNIIYKNNNKFEADIIVAKHVRIEYYDVEKLKINNKDK